MISNVGSTNALILIPVNSFFRLADIFCAPARLTPNSLSHPTNVCISLSSTVRRNCSPIRVCIVERNNCDFSPKRSNGLPNASDARAICSSPFSAASIFFHALSTDSPISSRLVVIPSVVSARSPPVDFPLPKLLTSLFMAVSAASIASLDFFHESSCVSI